MHASSGDSNRETTVVVNGSEQIIARPSNEIMNGIHGNTVPGKLSLSAYADTVAWLGSLVFACFA